MATQTSLFDTDWQPKFAEASGLLVLSQPGRPLSTAQRTFNRLVREIERLQAELASETRRLDKALAYYGQHVHPRLQRQNELRKQIVRLLAVLVTGNQLKTKRDRRAVSAILMSG